MVCKHDDKIICVRVSSMIEARVLHTYTCMFRSCLKTVFVWTNVTQHSHTRKKHALDNALLGSVAAGHAGYPAAEVDLLRRVRPGVGSRAEGIQFAAGDPESGPSLSLEFGPRADVRFPYRLVLPSVLFRDFALHVSAASPQAVRRTGGVEWDNAEREMKVVPRLWLDVSAVLIAYDGWCTEASTGRLEMDGARTYITLSFQ